MQPVFRDDPYSSFNFEVLVAGISLEGKAAKGSFMEVSGLDVELPAIEYRNGSEDITVRKIPGLKKFTNIVLKRGFTGDLAFWNWIVKGLHGQTQRANMSIILLDESRSPVVQWNVTRAWPCKWKLSTLNAKENDIAIESMEICHEGFTIDGQA